MRLSQAQLLKSLASKLLLKSNLQMSRCPGTLPNHISSKARKRNHRKEIGLNKTIIVTRQGGSPDKYIENDGDIRHESRQSAAHKRLIGRPLIR